MCDKGGVYLGEGPRSEEPRVGRQWGGVRCRQDRVAGFVARDDRVIEAALGVVAPGHDDDVRGGLENGCEELCCQLLPTEAGVRTRGADRDGEDRVQEEDTLRGPGEEAA